MSGIICFVLYVIIKIEDEECGEVEEKEMNQMLIPTQHLKLCFDYL